MYKTEIEFKYYIEITCLNIKVIINHFELNQLCCCNRRKVNRHFFGANFLSAIYCFQIILQSVKLKHVWVI